MLTSLLEGETVKARQHNGIPSRKRNFIDKVLRRNITYWSVPSALLWDMVPTYLCVTAQTHPTGKISPPIGKTASRLIILIVAFN